MKSAFLSVLINRLTAGYIKYGWYNSRFTSSDEPVVVGGCSRSGTTLLHAILNAHSRMFIAFEIGLTGGHKDLNYLMKQTNLPLSELKSLYRTSRCSADFAERVLNTAMRARDKTRWGDKTPSNVRSIEKLFRYFPKARFIHIIRDGRDVVCSLRTHKGTFKRKRPPTESVNPWPDCIQKWVTSVSSGIAWHGDPRYYELKYEALVGEPEITLQPLFQWLGESWEPEILVKAQLTERPSHPGVSQPINRKALGRWQSDLPKEARELFRGSPNNLLMKLGYEDNDKWIS